MNVYFHGPAAKGYSGSMEGKPMPKTLFRTLSTTLFLFTSSLPGSAQISERSCNRSFQNSFQEAGQNLYTTKQEGGKIVFNRLLTFGQTGGSGNPIPVPGKYIHLYYYTETEHEGDTALNVKLLYRLRSGAASAHLRDHLVYLKRNVWDDLPASRKCESIGLNTYEIWHSRKKAAKYEECLVKYFHETDYNLTKKDGANTFDTVASYERRLKFRFGFQQHEASNLFSFLAPALADTPGILDPSHYAELHSQIYTYHLHPGQGQGHCTAFRINRIVRRLGLIELYGV
jgi:hypothetical protein